MLNSVDGQEAKCLISRGSGANMEQTSVSVQSQSDLMEIGVTTLHEKIYTQYHDILAREFTDTDQASLRSLAK